MDVTSMQDTPNSYLNFLQSIIPTLRVLELVIWEDDVIIRDPPLWHVNDIACYDVIASNVSAETIKKLFLLLSF
jgi:hypothetical protein